MTERRGQRRGVRPSVLTLSFLNVKTRIGGIWLKIWGNPRKLGIVVWFSEYACERLSPLGTLLSAWWYAQYDVGRIMHLMERGGSTEESKARLLLIKAYKWRSGDPEFPILSQWEENGTVRINGPAETWGQYRGCSVGQMAQVQTPAKEPVNICWHL